MTRLGCQSADVGDQPVPGAVELLEHSTTSSSTETITATELFPYFFVTPSSQDIAPGATGIFTVGYDALDCGEQNCVVTVALPAHGETCGSVTCSATPIPEIDFGDVDIGQNVT